MDSTSIGLFVVGLVGLVGGGELLVAGASGIARALGLTPLVIGLTVVAFGTSAPELLVSTVAAREGRAAIAAGNIVGSNVFNVLFILGLCALVRPLVVANDLVRRDVPVMIAASLLFWLLAADDRIGPGEAALLLAGLVAFVAFTVWETRQPGIAGPGSDPAPGARHVARDVGFVVVGLGLLVGGARAFVHAAVTLAASFGVSEAVIGLTIVAAGTSLPEVAASAVATVRGQRDIAVGNVVGSCIFNLLGIGGVTAVVAGGLPVDPAIEAFDLPVMVAAALACLPLFATGFVLTRAEGGFFLAYYAAYTAYVVLAATEHDALPRFSAMMLYFVAPITAVTLALSAVTAIRTRGADGGRPLG